MCPSAISNYGFMIMPVAPGEVRTLKICFNPEGISCSSQYLLPRNIRSTPRPFLARWGPTFSLDVSLGCSHILQGSRGPALNTVFVSRHNGSARLGSAGGSPGQCPQPTLRLSIASRSDTAHTRFRALKVQTLGYGFRLGFPTLLSAPGPFNASKGAPTDG